MNADHADQKDGAGGHGHHRREMPEKRDAGGAAWSGLGNGYGERAAS